MKKLVLLAVLGLVAGSANAATYTILSGDWDNTASWNNNAAGEPSVGTTFDNGDASPACLLNFAACSGFGLDWNPVLPATLDGTYSGTLIVDDVTNEVTGGSLIVTGSIGDVVEVGGSSWWFRGYTNLVVDFGAGTQGGSTFCSQGVAPPAGCVAILPGQSTTFVPNGGEATLPDGTESGLTFLGATFVDGVLEIYNEGRTGTTGTDVLNTFNIEAQIVPVPAAVWLFGSALGLLGFVRRRMTA